MDPSGGEPSPSEQISKGPTPRASLAATFHSLLESKAGEDLALGELFDRIGPKGYGLLLILLSLPSAMPVPAPGYSTPFGIVISLIALQMVLARPAPWLPAWARKRRLSPAFAAKLLRGSEVLFRQVERFVRPRWQWLGGRGAGIAVGILVLVMALLMVLPIPLTNTAPALVIFLVGIGLSERDGLFTAAAFVLGVAATCLYGAIVTILLLLGQEGLDRVLDYVRSSLSG